MFSDNIDFKTSFICCCCFVGAAADIILASQKEDSGNLLENVPSSGKHLAEIFLVPLGVSNSLMQRAYLASCTEHNVSCNLINALIYYGRNLFWGRSA